MVFWTDYHSNPTPEPIDNVTVWTDFRLATSDFLLIDSASLLPFCDIRLPADRLGILVDETSPASRQSRVLGSPHPCSMALPSTDASRRRPLLSDGGRCDVDTWWSGDRAGDATGRLCAAGGTLPLPVSQNVRLYASRLRCEGLDVSGVRRTSNVA